MKVPKILERAILLLLVTAACVSLLQGLRNAVVREGGSQDAQWGPGRALLDGTDPYAAYLNRRGESPFILCQAPNYPASGLVFLWPYAMWDWPTAKALWALSNVAFTAIVLLCLFRLLPTGTPSTAKLLIAALFLIGTPWRNAVGNGQQSLFTLSLFLLSVVFLRRNAVAAGIVLASSWLKYTIAFPLSLFFTRSRRGWLAILIAATIHVALTVFAAAWTRTSPIQLLLGPIQVAQTATGKGYLDVFAIAAEIGLSSKLLPFGAALAILGITYIATRRDPDALSCLSTLSIASMTVCFHLIYDFVVLVIPLSYAIRERAGSSRARRYIVVVVMIWFVDKAVRSSSDLLASGLMDWAVLLWFWVKALVLYAVLCADWAGAFRGGAHAPREEDGGPDLQAERTHH